MIKLFWYNCRLFEFLHKWNVSNDKSSITINKCLFKDDAENTLKHFEIKYRQSNNIKVNKTLKTLINIFKYEALIPFTLMLIQDCILKSIQPILIGLTIRSYQQQQHPITSPSPIITSEVALCLITFMIIICHHASMFLSLRLSMRIKVLWSSIIYKKLLLLSCHSKYVKDMSKIMNLLTLQTRRFDELSLLINYLIIIPVQTLIILIIAYYYVGPICLLSFILFSLFSILNLFMSKRISAKRLIVNRLTNKRLKYLNEIFENLHTIKLLSIEYKFLQRIRMIRCMEMNKLQIPLVWRSLMLSFSLMSSRLIMYVTFIISTYLINDHLNEAKFSLEIFFISLTFFERLRFALIWTFPQSFSSFNDFMFACRQMDSFLREHQIDLSKINHSKSVKTPILNVDRLYLRQYENCIQFKIEPGQILIITGPIGSGKSTLLLNLLGELSQANNHFNVNGKIAYTQQETFHSIDTIRNNILFGQKFNQKRFNDIIKLTCLDIDLEALSLNDQTIISHNNLSIGQQSRIAIARALYSDADIYLFDDPFSSLDQRLVETIFKNCIRKYLHNKIVIIVTHQSELINNIRNNYDNVLLLVLNRQLKRVEFIDKSSSSYTISSVIDCGGHENVSIDSNTFNAHLTASIIDKHTTMDQMSEPAIMKIYKDLSNYLKYGSYNFGSIYLVLISSISAQLTLYLCDQWSSKWPSSTESITQFICIYTAFISIGIIMTLIRSTSFYKLCHQSSQLFHNELIEKIILAKFDDYMKLVNNNQILNHFSSDINVLDEQLPSILFELNLSLSQVIAIIVVILFLSPYLALITIIYVSILLSFVQHFHQPSNQMRQTELLAKNKLFTHLKSTIDGILTIRSFCAQNHFLHKFNQYRDQHAAILLNQNIWNRIYCFSIDLLSLFYIIFILISLKFIPFNHHLIGICLTIVFNLIGLTQWSFKRIIDLDYSLNSYRNLLLFQQLKIEDFGENSDSIGLLSKNRKQKSKFSIQIKQMSSYYNNDHSKPILEKINVNVKHGEKIAICGRSGSGKSTLINTLLSLVHFDGTILINGHRSRELSLKNLRRNLFNIIPQCPILFNGTIRENLCLLLHHDDYLLPNNYQQISDDLLWHVLDSINLANLIRSFPKSLDEEINENGDNLFSVGQKQLFCLARILLINKMIDNKQTIIIMDEATAYCDDETDHQIQRVLRDHFRHHTLLFIAHRLNTIKDFDRVLVINHGQIIENDRPMNLLKNENSHFYQLFINNL